MKTHHLTRRLSVLLAVLALGLAPIPVDAMCIAGSSWLYKVELEGCRAVGVAQARDIGEELPYPPPADQVEELLRREPGVVLTGRVLERREIPPEQQDGITAGPWHEPEHDEPFEAFYQTRGGCWPEGMGKGETVVVHVSSPCCDVLPPIETACLLSLNVATEVPAELEELCE